MDRPQLCADYLVVGAGLAGLGFVDILLKEDRSCTVVIADLFEKPGGKYNVWPSFCEVGGPDTVGVETKKFEGSTAYDMLWYCQEVMRSFIKSGRVRFFPRHRADETGARLTHALDPDRGYTMCITRKVVDATSMLPRTQVGPKHDIEVDGSVQLVSPCSMPTITSAHAQYVVIGSGYIGTRTVLWLLSAGVSPQKILWVVPRWWRFAAQEAADAIGEALNKYAACLCTFPSLIGFGIMMEEEGLAHRPCTRPDVELIKHHSYVSKEDINMVREVTNVIRLGHVRKISSGCMLLDGGTYKTAEDAMYIDCTGSRMHYRGKVEPVWQGERIKLQRLQETPFSDLSFSAGMIGMIEARFPRVESDTLKNALCSPVPYSDSLVGHVLACVPQLNIEAWKHKDLQRMRLDQVGMRVNPVGTSMQQMKHAKQYSEVELRKKVANNIMRVVAAEDPEAVQNFPWFRVESVREFMGACLAASLPATIHDAAQHAKVDASAEEDTDSVGGTTREPSSRRVSGGSDVFFDFDILDGVVAAS